MLSIAKLGAGGQRYYLDQAQARVDHRQSVSSGVEDYYLAAPEAPGVWMGAEAARLGLDGRVVDEESLHRALSWSDPLTGVELEGPIRQARVPGFDLMFSVPKSASVLFGICDKDVRTTIRRAQEEAVKEALGYLQSVACRGRLGAGGQGEGFAGRGFLAAAFEHRTSRAGDPQLHTHVLIANAVQRPDGLWAALDGRLIYAHAKTAGYIHEAAFRRALSRDLGLQWQPPVNGIADIRGVPERALDAFSRRSREIDAYVLQRGEHSAAARQIAAVRTREAKDYAVRPAQLVPEWRERAAALGLTQERVDELVRRFGPAHEALPDEEVVAKRLAGRDGLTKGASHFDRRDVLQQIAAMARQGAGWDEIESMADSFLASVNSVPLVPESARRSEVIRRADGRIVTACNDQRYTTRALLDAERRVLESVRARRSDGVAIAVPSALDAALTARPSIGDDQAAMVRRLTAGGAGVQIVVGPAGSGKTFALETARAAWEASGIDVRGAAVARAAAHVLHDEAGIESTSIAALLNDLRRGVQQVIPHGGVLIVDEAGMLGTFDLAEILEHAEAAAAKVVLVGDPQQLPEIDAGGCFRSLASEPEAIVLDHNRRQRHTHDREKVDLLRAGRTGEALSVAAAHGDVVIAANGDELMERIVADYCAAVPSGESCIMIAARRSEVAEFNARARAAIDALGGLGKARIDLAGGEFATGDRVVIKRNDRRLGVQNGNRGCVTGVDTQSLRVGLDDGRQVVLDARFLTAPARGQQPSLVHGYAATAHVLQGQTADRAFVLGSDSIYREWGYVAMTRARERTMFYVCDDEMALDALGDSPAQRTAHELAAREEVAGMGTDQLAAERCRLAERLRGDPRPAEARANERIQGELVAARQQLADATVRRDQGSRRRFFRRGPEPDTSDLARAQQRVDALERGLEQLRGESAGPRWAREHRDELVRLRLVDEVLDERVQVHRRVFRHAQPPPYVANALGERPDGAAPRRLWDSAIHKVERYRARHGVNDLHRPLGPRPAHNAGAWVAANRELEQAQRALGRRGPDRQHELFR